MMGDECPFPSIGVRQAMFCIVSSPVFLSLATLLLIGRFFSRDVPSSRGPRQHGQSSARTQTARDNTSRTPRDRFIAERLQGRVETGRMIMISKDIGGRQRKH